MEKMGFKHRYQIISGVFVLGWVGGIWSGQLWISSICAVIGGAFMAYFYKEISQMMCEAQEKQFGFTSRQWYPKFNRIMIRVMGVFFVLFGLLMLFNFQPITL